MSEAPATIAFLALFATILIAITAVSGLPKLLKGIAWLGILAIGIAAAYAYFTGGRNRSAEIDPIASPPTTEVGEIRATAPAPTPLPSLPLATPSSASPNESLKNVSERTETPAPSATETVLKKKAQTPLAQEFDLGDIIATAEWARLTQDRLEVSFRFTNKTQRPLWIIPATRREKGGIQASDDVKNRYQLRSTIGFSRGTDRLHKSVLNPNNFLELRPNVPAPASFIFTRPKSNVEEPTQIYFFATLSVVEDLKTFRSDNRTVSVTISVD